MDKTIRYTPKHGEVLEFFKSRKIDYRENGGDNIAFTCPFCGGGASHQKYTAYINTTTGLWQCWRQNNCAATGTYKQLVYKMTGGGKMGAEDRQEVQVEKVGIGANKAAVNIYMVSELEKLELADNAISYFEDRGISKSTLDRFKIKSIPDSDRLVYIPFLTADGDVIAFSKIRNINPQVMADGDYEKKELSSDGCPTFFAAHLLCVDSHTLVITEGETDAMSVREALESHNVTGYDVVSVPMGKNSLNFIDADTMGLLNSYKKIIVWGDLEDGKISLIDYFNVVLDAGVEVLCIGNYLYTKDANEYLCKYGTEAVIEALQNAKSYSDDRVVSFDNIKIDDNTDDVLMTTGYKELDELTDGIRAGSFGLLLGAEGAGKTTLCSQLAVQAAQQKIKTLTINFEMSLKDITNTAKLQSAGKKYIVRALSKTGSYYGKILDSAVDAKITKWLGRYVNIYLNDNDCIGKSADEIFADDIDANGKVRDICRAIEIQIKRQGVRFIIVDNLMSLCDVSEGNEEYTLQTKIAKVLNYLSKKYNVAILLCVHPRKVAQGSLHLTTDDIKGSSQTKNIADFIWSYEKYRATKDEQAAIDKAKSIQDGTTRQAELNLVQVPSGHIRILKNRNTGYTTSLNEKGIAIYYGGITKRCMGKEEKEALAKQQYIQYDWINEDV